MDIKTLEKQIIEASKQYYTMGSSGLSDKEFDLLVDKLRELDPQNPILTAVGWGWKPERGAKHHYDLIEGISDKRKIDSNETVDNGSAVYTSKLDGCSVCHYYKNGVYYQSITRGDGVVGTDVTHNVKDKLPQLPEYFTGYVRTECVVSYTNFKNYFPQDKSIRNIATGIITAKENKPLLKYVDLVPISVYIVHHKNPNMNCSVYMGNYGFNDIVKYFKHNIKYISVVGEDDINVIHADSKMTFSEDVFDELRCDYPSDGYICYKDDEILCAYKFDGEFAYPVVKYVESITQPTTKIYPRIWIEETEISDCRVNKVTGKSGEAILEGKVGAGAVIEIVRSGEVVPNWTKNVIKESTDVWVPKCSYGCDESFVKRDGANFYCTNPGCASILDGTVEKIIRHYAPKRFSDDMLEICFKMLRGYIRPDDYDDYEEDDGVYDANIISFFGDSSNINNLTILLYVVWEQLVLTPPMGTTAHQKKLIKATFDSMFEKKMSLYDLVSVCSVEAFGKTLSGELEVQLQGCSDVNRYLMDKKNFTASEVNNSKARDSWANRHELLSKVMSIFEIVIPEVKEVGDSKGTVCISGTLPSGMKKKEFADVIESKGYTWVEKLKKDTTILICSKPDSNKAMKAKKDGTTIMTEEEFNAL